jgi:hypothetical protein
MLVLRISVNWLDVVRMGKMANKNRWRILFFKNQIMGIKVYRWEKFPGPTHQMGCNLHLAEEGNPSQRIY